MNDHSTDQSAVTLGEVYRLCLSIKGDIEKQNGRVAKLEERVTAIEKEAVKFQTIWAAVVVIIGIGIDSIKHKLGL